MFSLGHIQTVHFRGSNHDLELDIKAATQERMDGVSMKAIQNGVTGNYTFLVIDCKTLILPADGWMPCARTMWRVQLEVEPFSYAIIFPHTHTRDSMASFPFSNKSTIIATDDRYDGLCVCLERRGSARIFFGGFHGIAGTGRRGLTMPKFVC